MGNSEGQVGRDQRLISELMLNTLPLAPWGMGKGGGRDKNREKGVVGVIKKKG